MPGPLPKAQHSRARDTRRRVTARAIKVEATGALVGPELAVVSGRADWPEAVLAWWAVWQAAPQAPELEGTDWQALVRAAYLVERYLIRPNASTNSEIRTVESQLGATLADRLRLRLQVTRDGSGPAASTASHLASVRELFDTLGDDE